MPDADTPEALAFRDEHARLNGRPTPRPAPRIPVGYDPDATVTMNLADIRAALAAGVAAEKPRRGLAWTATLVLVVLILASLVAWVSYLYFTHHP